MTKKTLLTLTALAALALAALFAWDGGLFAPPPPPLVETPEAVAAGRAVFAYRCLGCHHAVPLQGRVAGWSTDKAYDVIGRLPQVPKASMPAFPGSEEDRRAVAVFLHALGAGRATQPTLP